ncbi:MAG: hypothetical protein ABI120_23850 [Gemmatimonadaceae bacterium]
MINRQLHTCAFAVAAMAASIVAVSNLAAQCPAMTKNALPLEYAGPPTTAAVNACDLMTRLYRFANDSMGGRRVGLTAPH